MFLAPLGAICMFEWQRVLYLAPIGAACNINLPYINQYLFFPDLFPTGFIRLIILFSHFELLM